MYLILSLADWKIKEGLEVTVEESYLVRLYINDCDVSSDKSISQ